ncbi:MAG TPA: sugar phosphate isomerase/epimerase [Candidatus Gemmiger faecavium]|nr:sugar phosphate isomerase/epimerase [Candidatus Gemmiger faecavium]
MKIGFLTNALVEQAKRSGSDAFSTLDQVADWAADHGFTDLECGPMLPLDRAAYERVLAAGRIDITALIYCRNYLSTDAEEAANHLAELKKRIEFAGALGIDKVVTSTGIDKTIEEGIYDRDPNVKDRGNMIRRIPVRSLDRVVDLFGPLLELAEKNNVRLCFENCPLMGNIAISPVMWRRIFERLDSDKLGIAYDPSHLVWEMVDPYAPIDEFKDRIFHVHAKDAAIDREQLAQTGILTDFSWWSYRIPGRGELDWKKLLGMLKANGYDGTISLEHEDAAYEGTLEAVENGLLDGKAYLEQSMK